jgi:hypothetical protein
MLNVAEKRRNSANLGVALLIGGSGFFILALGNLHIIIKSTFFFNPIRRGTQFHWKGPLIFLPIPYPEKAS